MIDENIYVVYTKHFKIIAKKGSKKKVQTK